MDHKLLGIYLNDHLAGATVGRDLARRAAGANEGDERFGEPLAELAEEIEADRETLLGLMRDLEIGEDRLKEVGGWVGEKLGRLKLNGQLLGYAPLSRVVELEGLCVGIYGKRCLWLALDRVSAASPVLAGRDFNALVARAEDQLSRVQALRLDAAELALTVGLSKR